MQDANYVYTLLGEKPDGSIVPLKVSTDGELVIEYVVNGSSTGNQTPKEDDNYVTVNMAENNDLAVSLITDSQGRVVTSGITI